MPWTQLPHARFPLFTSDRGVLGLDRQRRVIRRLSGDEWHLDVTLPSDDDDDVTKWVECATIGERVVALRDDGFVADVDGSAPPRFFDTLRSPHELALHGFDATAAPARLMRIETDSDRGTWVLVGERWRRVRSRVPDCTMIACTTPAGLFVLGDGVLSRVTPDGWTPVAAFVAPGEDSGAEAGDAAPTKLACDPARGLLFGATETSIVALGAAGWQRVAAVPIIEGAPRTIVQLAVDRVADRLVAATKTSTFALPLAGLGLSGWLPGRSVASSTTPTTPMPPTTTMAAPGRLELTVEVYDAPAPEQRAALGTKRGEQLLACLPPDLAVFETSAGDLRVATVAPGGLPPSPVLYDPMRKRHFICRLVADETDETDDAPKPSGCTRIGGDPAWIQYDPKPKCKRCKAPLRFRAQLCEDFFDCWFGDAGRAYVFDCAAGCGAEFFVQS